MTCGEKISSVFGMFDDKWFRALPENIVRSLISPYNEDIVSHN